MGKITIVISDEKEELLRDYIRSKYRKPFGKLSEVVEESITRLLKEEGFKGLPKSKLNWQIHPPKKEIERRRKIGKRNRKEAKRLQQ